MPQVLHPMWIPLAVEVVVVVRPEELELRPGPADPGAITATVVDVAFLVAQRTVRLQSPALVR